MIVKASARFKRDYDRLPWNIRKKVKKTVDFLRQNLRYPSIRAKKLKGKRDLWEGRINRFYRFTFKIQKKIIILRRVGPHDKTLKA